MKILIVETLDGNKYAFDLFEVLSYNYTIKGELIDDYVETTIEFSEIKNIRFDEID